MVGGKECAYFTECCAAFTAISVSVHFLKYRIMAIGVTSCDMRNQWLTRDRDAHCKVIAVAVHLVATVLRGLLREYGIY